MYIAIHELLNNCASHYSYCGVDCSDLCAHMLQNDRKKEFLRMTDRKKCDMINSYIKIHTIKRKERKYRVLLYELRNDLQNQTEHLS